MYPDLCYIYMYLSPSSQECSHLVKSQCPYLMTRCVLWPEISTSLFFFCFVLFLFFLKGGILHSKGGISVGDGYSGNIFLGFHFFFRKKCKGWVLYGNRIQRGVSSVQLTQHTETTWTNTVAGGQFRIQSKLPRALGLDRRIDRKRRGSCWLRALYVTKFDLTRVDEQFCILISVWVSLTILFVI